MKTLFSIGRFSRLTGLSIKALRFYEAAGLLLPAVVDPETGYRYYRFHQRSVAARIRTLRELEVPLDVIQQMVHAEIPLQQALDDHEKQLELWIQQKQQVLRRLRQTRQVLEDHPLQFSRMPPHPVLVQQHTTSLEHSELDRKRVHGQLLEQASRLGLQPVAPPYTHHPPQGGFDPLCYQAILALPVDRSTPQTRPGFAGERLFVVHRGPLPDLHFAYQALAAWVDRQDCTRTSPWCESYVQGLATPASPTTEVWCIVKGAK